MKCDNCGKELRKFCFAIPQSSCYNRLPRVVCSLKCLKETIKKLITRKEKKNDK